MLRMTKEQLNDCINNNPTKLVGIVQPILNHRCDLYKRYSRGSTMATSMSGNGKIVPFEYYIVKMAQGYLSGKAPTYNISGKKGYVKKYNEKIDYVRRYNDDGATFSDLMHDYLTMAAAYLYIYENEDNEIVYTQFDARQTVCVYDYNTPANLIACIRSWSEPKDNGNITILEIITELQRIQWRANEMVVLEDVLQWGDVPVVALEEPDGIAIFEPAMSEIDIYEQMTNNLANMTQYNDNAKLLLTGYAIPEDYYTTDENGEEIENPKRIKYEKKLFKSKVLSVANDGKIEWLLKQIDYTGILDVLKSKHEAITMLTGVPNMTDEAFANADNASALGYKLYALDQYAATADRIFRKGYLRLWEIITNRWNTREGGYDFRDIDIVMQRNLPTDRDKSIDRAVKMHNSGLFSAETCIAESQVEVDPVDEITKVKQEEEAEYELMASRGMTVEENE